MKVAIEEDLIKQYEFVDEVQEIYDINGYQQKGKKFASCLGGYYFQFAYVIYYLNKKVPEYMTEERLTKTLELFLPKSPAVHIVYKSEDLENYRNIDTNIASIEDISKLEEKPYSEVFELVISNLLVNNEVLRKLLQDFSEISPEIKDCYYMFMISLMKNFKSTDISIYEKIKFIMEDPSLKETNLIAVCELYPASIPKPKAAEIIQPITTKKTNIKQKPVASKTIFESDFYEKALIMPNSSDKMRILSVNYNFERMLRHNIIECMNKLYRIEADKEAIKVEMEEFYINNFAMSFVDNLAKELNKEKLSFDIDPSHAH